MSHHYSGPDWGFPHGDARLDLTDLYAFPKPEDASRSILIINVHPSARDFLDRENPLGPTTLDPFHLRFRPGQGSDHESSGKRWQGAVHAENVIGLHVVSRRAPGEPPNPEGATGLESQDRTEPSVTNDGRTTS